MNFYEKYLKYKNKYLSLKGGDRFSDEFIENIKIIIDYVCKLPNIRFNSIIKEMLIFNIFLYSGFIYRKKLIEVFNKNRDDIPPKFKILQDGLWSSEEKIKLIFNNYGFSETNYDLLKDYSIKYYDNYPEIFNFNNDIDLAKYSSGNPLNINDLFCLIIMIINNNFDNIYICLLKKVTDLLIEKKNIKNLK